MFLKLVTSLVLLAVLAGQGTVAEENKDGAALLNEARQLAQLSVGKRSKRDSAPPDFSEDKTEVPDDEAPLPPSMYSSVDVAEMLNDPARAAVLQTLYDLARADDDMIGKDGNADGFLTFTYAPDGNEDDDDDDEKRARLFVGKRARLFVGKRPRLFVGKRRLFVGKRQRLFVGKRPRLFVGKRQRVFVGKRPRLFVGKRQRLFVGKRDWQANVQRRLQDFLEQKDKVEGDSTKRSREFVGKRSYFPIDYQTDKRPQRMFVGKRSREFVGKRNFFPFDFQADKRPQRMFVGKRDDYTDMLHRVNNMVDKRARLFVGKRGQTSGEFPDEEKRFREFVGKRQQEFVNGGDASGAAEEVQGETMGDKRSSRMFVGKRADSAPYDLMEKRHRFFVGKRGGVFESNDNKGVNDDAADTSSGSEEGLQELKRSREFVGRR